jgi:FkbM family methyltransferase
MLSSLTGKSAQYTRELKLCFQIGVGWKNRIALTSDTLLFHLGNGLKAPNRSVSPKSRTVSLNGQVRELWMRRYGGDIFVFHEVFLSQSYRLPTRWLSDIKTVVDLGANVGFTTLYLSQYLPEARFVCVEPEPSNISLLKHNLRSMRNRVKVIEGAVADRSGEAWFARSAPSWGGQLVENGVKGTPVRCYTMDEIIRAAGLSVIDMMKVDIEGAEKQLLSGRKDWLRNVKLLIIELHGDYSIEHFRQDLYGHGFEVFAPSASRGNRMIVALSAELAAREM